MGKSTEGLATPAEFLSPAFTPFVTRQACTRTPGLLGPLGEKLQPACEETESWIVRKPPVSKRCELHPSSSSATQQQDPRQKAELEERSAKLDAWWRYSAPCRPGALIPRAWAGSIAALWPHPTPLGVHIRHTWACTWTPNAASEALTPDPSLPASCQSHRPGWCPWEGELCGVQ